MSAKSEQDFIRVIKWRRNRVDHVGAFLRADSPLGYEWRWVARRPSRNESREVLCRRNSRSGGRNLPDLICGWRCQYNLNASRAFPRLDAKMPLSIFLREGEGRAGLSVGYDNCWSFGVFPGLADLQDQD